MYILASTKPYQRQFLRNFVDHFLGTSRIGPSGLELSNQTSDAKLSPVSIGEQHPKCGIFKQHSNKHNCLNGATPSPIQKNATFCSENGLVITLSH